jgi:hypothetical protein
MLVKFTAARASTRPWGPLLFAAISKLIEQSSKTIVKSILNPA